MILLLKILLVILGCSGSHTALLAETEEPPRFFAAARTGVPELLSFRVGWRFSPYGQIHGFASPPIPFNVRVELPQDKLTASNKVIIENPATEIRFKGVYGPIFGVGGAYYPFGGSFRIQANLSHRFLTLTGQVETPLILRSETTGDAITTNTVFGIKAKASTRQWVGDGSFGWSWRLGSSFGVTLDVGISSPMSSNSSVEASTWVYNPAAVEQPGLDKTLAQLQAAKEAELEEKAREEIKVVDHLSLPYAALGLQWHF